MAERLHEEIRLELETGQLLELVGRHRAGRVLGADRGHLRLAGRPRQDAGSAAGLAHDLLRLGIPLARLGRGIPGRYEEGRILHAQRPARLVRQLTADDQVETPPGAKLIPEGGRLEFKPDGGLAALVPDFAGLGIED